MPTLAEWDGSDGKNVDMKKHKLLLFMMFILFILFFFAFRIAMLGSARRKDSGQATRQKFMHKISGGSLDYGYGSKHPMDPALGDDWFFFSSYLLRRCLDPGQ